MIKRTIFNALIGSVLGLLMFSGVCYASTGTGANFSITINDYLDQYGRSTCTALSPNYGYWYFYHIEGGQAMSFLRLQYSYLPDIALTNFCNSGYTYPPFYVSWSANDEIDRNNEIEVLCMTTAGWYYFPTPVSAVSITAPETGSTITDDTTELAVSWENIDSAIWTELKIVFNDYLIGESSVIYTHAITTDDGSFSIPLSTFAITKNGSWTLTAVVENATEINFDIPNPTYALTFNISGLPSGYVFTDFDTWYSENVDNYATPSAWGSAMVGFLEPIFVKIGEFGNRITSYLDTSTAYEKGNTIGAVFPVVLAYVGKIDLFFGGFPMFVFFKWIIILMIGLFAVKVILKLLSFIPFFGGGG